MLVMAGGFTVVQAQPGTPARSFPKPGQIVPEFLQERLKLNAEQTKQLEALQKEVDEKLAKILTDEQKKSLQRPPWGLGGRRSGGPPQGFASTRTTTPAQPTPSITINIYMTPDGPALRFGPPGVLPKGQKGPKGLGGFPKE